MARNLANKILQEHLVEGHLQPGTPIALLVDQTLLQDATGTMACMQFDHNVVQLDYKNPDDHRMLRAIARKYGLLA